MRRALLNIPFFFFPSPRPLDADFDLLAVLGISSSELFDDAAAFFDFLVLTWVSALVFAFATLAIAKVRVDRFGRVEGAK